MLGDYPIEVVLLEVAQLRSRGVEILEFDLPGRKTVQVDRNHLRKPSDAAQECLATLVVGRTCQAAARWEKTRHHDSDHPRGGTGLGRRACQRRRRFSVVGVVLLARAPLLGRRADRLRQAPSAPPGRDVLGVVAIKCYHTGMSVRKLSVSLEEAVVVAAAATAERRGMSLSAWLNAAAANALALEDGLAAVAEWEAEHGALAEEELAAADAVLRRASDSSKRAQVA